MNKKDTKRLSFQCDESNTFIDIKTGEIIQENYKSRKSYKLPKEPPFVKLYLDCLCKFKDVQLSFNPILIEFLKNTSYADIEDIETGGQIIYLNKMLKENIAKRCNVSLKRVEQAITEFVKKGYMHRLGVGTYQFDANLFGKGEWADIYNIRANFNFGTGEVIADIVKNEEEEINKATDEITEKSIEKLKKTNNQ
ncbi:MAG: hypothetical protein IJZ71_09640 [Treponema sp.]|nr:hypothetical protein [Treponema sp.]